MTDKQYDILIVGASLVGASLACAVAGDPSCAGLRIGIVEPEQAPQRFSGEDFDPRVVALTRQSQRFLENLGVWSAITRQRLCPYTHMFVWDGEGTASIEFNSRDLREENLGHIVENSVVLSALLEHLTIYPNVEILRGRRIEQVYNGFAQSGNRRTTLVLDDDENIETTLVLAADGGNSKVRELLAMKTREWDYGQDAIVTTVRSERPHGFTAWQRFTHTGPLAFLPLATEDGDLHFSSIVWSVDRELSPELMALDDESFARRLGATFEHKLGDITRVASRYSFPLRQRHALDYVQPGFALVGDAAHTIHPLAGQGVNLGLADAQALAAELARAMRRRIPLSDYSVLQRYARSRKGTNLGMMAVMEGFKRLFGSRSPELQVIRNMGMRQMDGLPMVKNLLARQAMGLR
ncbi:UbiH/UbiF/VisC/COQ6 family ubiquinone biosynthesis hydroxylase [Proteobacteria bacterium 005FR1]|nr:UbiH/UbiF/VisC/COQ6 family ubiquinone biosynthesis hydroxylase [Proteobacteria bacterium 005FR1]